MLDHLQQIMPLKSGRHQLTTMAVASLLSTLVAHLRGLILCARFAAVSWQICAADYRLQQGRGLQA